MYKILIGLFLSVLCLQAKCQMQFDEGSFSEVLAKAKQEKRMVFMDCYTSWCGPCKMLSLVLDQIKDVKIVKVDVDESPNLCKQYAIMSVPTLMIFKNGTPVDTLVGFMPKDSLKAAIIKHL